MATSNWIYDGKDAFYDVREKTTTYALGATNRAVQRQKVFVFRRHRYVELSGAVTIVDGDLGTTNGGTTIKAYQGSYELTAGAIVIGGDTAEWVCTQDEWVPEHANCNWYRQEQTWEWRNGWEDWDWPTA